MIPDICGMQILLAAATTFEIQPTIDALSASSDGLSAFTNDGISGSTGALSGSSDDGISGSSHQIRVLVTGVGGIATTWSLMRQIDRARPDLIIQAGIAGCLRDRQPGEVFAIGEDRFADLGVWEEQRFKTLFDMRLASADEPPFTGGRLVNPYRRLLALSGLETVGGLTVNEITTSVERVRWYQQNTPAVVESMEGGPLHYVCLQERVPFLQLRSVSNTVGVRDKTKWDIKLAISRLNGQLLGLLNDPALNKGIFVER